MLETVDKPLRLSKEAIRAARELEVRRHWYIDPRYSVIRDPQDPRLHVKSKRIKDTQSPEILELSKQLVAHHLIEGGLGLAACQIGVNLAMAVVQPPDFDRPMVVYNPRIVNATEMLPDEQGSNMAWDHEGCISHEGVIAEVARVKQFDVYMQSFSKPKMERYRVQGWLARVLQHEIDHINGILFTDRQYIRNLTVDPAGQLRLQAATAESAENGYTEPDVWGMGYNHQT